MTTKLEAKTTDMFKKLRLSVLNFFRTPETISLIQCCMEIQKHLDGGEEPEWFSRGDGMCRNYYRYVALHPGKYEVRDDLVHFPFNGGEPQSFVWEMRAGVLYENPLRLAFIRKWAEKGGYVRA